MAATVDERIVHALIVDFCKPTDAVVLLVEDAGSMGGAYQDVIPGSSQADDIIATQEVGVLGVVAENGCSKNIGSE